MTLVAMMSLLKTSFSYIRVHTDEQFRDYDALCKKKLEISGMSAGDDMVLLLSRLALFSTEKEAYDAMRDKLAAMKPKIRALIAQIDDLVGSPEIQARLTHPESVTKYQPRIKQMIARTGTGGADHTFRKELADPTWVMAHWHTDSDESTAASEWLLAVLWKFFETRKKTLAPGKLLVMCVHPGCTTKPHAHKLCLKHGAATVSYGRSIF